MYYKSSKPRREPQTRILLGRGPGEGLNKEIFWLFTSTDSLKRNQRKEKRLEDDREGREQAERGAYT
jgi:hypothetical protein